MQNILYLNDGEDFSIVVKLPPSLTDPAGLYPAIGQAFRVIANSYGPTLKIVPLADKPRLLTEVPNK